MVTLVKQRKVSAILGFQFDKLTPDDLPDGLRLMRIGAIGFRLITLLMQKMMDSLEIIRRELIELEP